MIVRMGGVYYGQIDEFVHDAQICAQKFWKHVDH